MGNKRNVSEENESIAASIDELSTDDDSYDGSINKNSRKSIQDVNYVHLDINARDARLKIRDRIRQEKI